jgi:hypothetical protein
MVYEAENACFDHLYSSVEHQSYGFIDASMIINKTIWLRPVLHYQKK